MEVLFDRAALMDYFDFYLSNQDVEKPKPDPEIYSMAIQRFGIHPSQCLILEDNENGIRAARASGAHLLVISDVAEVNLENITKRILEIEEKS